MATWVIGDVHGCWQTLSRLLERICWQPGDDELWLVGDLVNRGPSSLEVLRWARDNGDHLKVVLGNHDLHLLGRAAGVVTSRDEDTLDELLQAPDGDELVDWLRTRPLLHHFGPWIMVHAGLMPGWSIEVASRLAQAASARLAGPDWREVIRNVHRHRKSSWSSELKGEQMITAALAVFTRQRMVGPDGRAQLAFSGAPGEAPEGWRPWFQDAAVRRQGYALIFGHWAMLGVYRIRDVACLDAGCVYGGALAALHLQDGEVVREPLADKVG
jgi:bis(5'-nucleosyl)-tetraphosphatase (symmetrical)